MGQGKLTTIEDHLRGIAGLVLAQQKNLELSDEERERIGEFFIDCYSVTAENVLTALVEMSVNVILDDEEDTEDPDDEEDEDGDEDEDDEDDDEDEDEDEAGDEDEDADGEEEEDGDEEEEDGDEPGEAAPPGRR